MGNFTVNDPLRIADFRPNTRAAFLLPPGRKHLVSPTRRFANSLTPQQEGRVLAGRARLRRAVTFSHEIEFRLDGVSPYQFICTRMTDRLQKKSENLPCTVTRLVLPW